MLQDKKSIVYLILAGLFITNAVVAELISGKLIQVGPFIMSIGIIPWPVVFLTTDLINEFYGKKGVRQLSLLTTMLIGYAFFVGIFYDTKYSTAFSGKNCFNSPYNCAAKVSLCDKISVGRPTC